MSSSTTRIPTGPALNGLPDLLKTIKPLEPTIKMDGSKTRNSILRIHLYEFDGCLFNTPVPNREIMTQHALRSAMEGTLPDLGWFDRPYILRSTGQSPDSDIIDPSKWSHYFCKKLVELAHDSKTDPATVSVLVSSRLGDTFKELLQELTSFARGGEPAPLFDMFYLRDHIRKAKMSSKALKWRALRDLLLEFPMATEIIAYECAALLPIGAEQQDSFEKMIHPFRQDLKKLKKPIDFRVYPIAHEYCNFDPVLEWKILCNLITENNNLGNELIKREGYHRKLRHFTISKLVPIERKSWEICPEDWGRIVQIMQDLAPNQPTSRRFYGKILEPPAEEEESSGTQRVDCGVSRSTITLKVVATGRTNTGANNKAYIYRCLSPHNRVYHILATGPRATSDSFIQATEYVSSETIWHELPEDRWFNITAVSTTRVYFHVIPADAVH